MRLSFKIPFYITAFTFIFVILVPTGLYSGGSSDPPDRERKTLIAVRTGEVLKIDGFLDDAAWRTMLPAGGFFQYEPHNDRPASFPTEVRVLYDDRSLYIGARMSDPDPERILTELGLRDENNLNADSFTIEINPFDDGLYGFLFRVSASGVQSDAAIETKSGWRDGDYSWDAVWKSAARITEKGWEAEIKIPYAALRFPVRDVQSWGINFWREVRRTRETSSWNYVDRRIANKVGSMGVLAGVRGIKPPLRLAFFPYTSVYLEKNASGRNWTGAFNGGMDIKYGVNQSFTLDTTLIPDFGQVQSDALELNLSPYEIKYDEKRQFFTESTELFSKADLFYSRRIGGIPYRHDELEEQLEENEVILSNPRETRLINATKLSGRTSGGLGIGIFNAMTAPAHARLIDTETGVERKVQTQPFSNYTLFVLDQSLKNNSFISLVNGAVLGLESGYTSNITGTEFRFLDRTRSYRISGTAALSQQYRRGEDDIFGYKYSLEAGRFAGTWQYSYSRDLVSDTYNQNDIGYLRRADEFTDTVTLSHNIYSPFWILNTLSNGITVSRNAMYSSGRFASLSIGYNVRLLFNDRFMLVGNVNFFPEGQRDFYEARVPGRFYETQKAYDVFIMYSSNYRNPVYVDGDLSYEKKRSVEGQDSLFLNFKPTFRISDRFKLSLDLGWGKYRNDIGYTSHTDEKNIYFGRRNAVTLVPGIRTTVMFRNNLSLSVNVRHYWSKVKYTGDYYLLGMDGELTGVSGAPAVPDINYNSFTMDTQLVWNFAPGSQLSLVWKNSIDHLHDTVIGDYFENARFMFNRPQVNSLSIKMLYYLDHRSLRR